MSKIVYLYVLDTMADWETGYLTAELHSGRFFKKGLAPLHVKTVGIQKIPVVTMGGIRIVPDISPEDCIMEQAAALILPGADTWMEPVHDPVLRMADKWLQQGIVVGAICGATMALAQKGFLNNRRHTSNDLEFLKATYQEYNGEKYYVQEPAAEGGNLITASGSAPLEFAVHMLKKLDVFSAQTMDAWYGLQHTHNAKYFYELMDSIHR